MSEPSRRNRILTLGLLSLVALVLFVIAVDRGARRSNDFDNFHDAAASVWHDGELFLEKGTFRYLASFQVLFSPLGALPIAWAAAVFALLNLACLAVLPRMFERASGIPPGRQWPAWLLVAPFVVNNMTLGQSGPLLLVLATFGIDQAARSHAVRGGAALAVAAWLKVFPAALLAVPACLGRLGGALAGTVAATAAIALWVALAIGPQAGIDDMQRWLTEVRAEQTPQHMVEVVRGLRYNNQGLAVTLARTFTDYNEVPHLAAKGSVQLAKLPVEFAWYTYYAVIAILGTVLAWLTWQARREPTPIRFFGLYALAIPAMLALSPLVWTHYFLWLVVPALYALEHRRTWVIGLALASVLAVFSIPARALGAHMLIGFALFGLCAARLHADTANPSLHADTAAEPSPSA